MKYLRIFCFIMALCLTTNVSAQKTKRKAKPKPKEVVETPGQKLFKSMLPSTAKVMFVDSIVVPKRGFLTQVPLNKESGTLTMRDNSGNTDNAMMQYENDFHDLRFFAMGDTLASSIYYQAYLGKQWAEPVRLTSIDHTEYTKQNYPFLASDGVTLYFSAEGQNSVGGRDIFMTRYDSEKGEWYEPQNFGLPFNSPANEYLLAINDLDTLGWLVSDRYQPEDSVCIYTFVPTNPRQDFTNNNLSNTQLERYARIASISDTWGFGNKQLALQRRNNMLSRQKNVNHSKSELYFVVNDQQVITSASQLKSDESRKLYAQYVEVSKMLETTENDLESKRLVYGKGNKSQQVKSEILKLEKDLLRQRADLISLEKRIRAAETR